MKSFGVCIGATTLSIVQAGKGSNGGGKTETRLLVNKPHHGDPRAVIRSLFAEIPMDGARIAVTGRKLCQAVNLTTISEPEALEAALYHLNGRGSGIDTVISAGGENILVYILGKDGKICAVKSGNKCASGTGEFYVQQLRRIGLSPEDATRVARKTIPYRVSSRCSVFCKSDCTHAANAGISGGRIVAGLCEMIAGKIMEVVTQTPDRERVMMIGGMTQNRVLVDYLKNKVKELIVPDEACYFEALGAALWAMENETIPLPEKNSIIKEARHNFSSLRPLYDFRDLVEFKTMERGEAAAGDLCLLGLDVGSTTTKAVLMRMADNRILKSIYLRTNGNPVAAARACFTSLYDQLGDLAERMDIIGLGVTGSGRQIAGLYAMTQGVINEIIAHAAGAVFFDPAVETIFEIGGQDAKYTYLDQGAPSDYAMNDACSAGTGSFLEEAARETMGVAMEDIGSLALRGKKPPNFNDQCAAFISSDIKNAFQDGLTKEDILAGLVYSICMNYNNRVKGNRLVGKKVFMQGGVCYNRAVPLAMAALTGKRIIVPPEPGLVGALGVALEIKKRLHADRLVARSYSLKTLKDRNFEHRRSFHCHGGKESCDRNCEITRVRVEGKTYPFGGACNRWYNLRSHFKIDEHKLDFVRKYEKHIFSDHGITSLEKQAGKKRFTVGINKSFHVNALYPLYSYFFHRLGFQVLLPDTIDAAGIASKGASFCYPAELAHGFFRNLLDKRPDYLFLPQLKGMSRDGSGSIGTVCPLSQGEPYYLTVANKENETMAGLRNRKKVLKPVLDFTRGHKEMGQTMASAVEEMGVRQRDAHLAYGEAITYLEKTEARLRKESREALQELEKNLERQAIVIVGRSYNAFVSEANMGIPQKIASRGIMVLPYAFLPLEGEEVTPEMYWEAGRTILKSTQFIARHPQLFPCYITNFSCGPDSFLVEYFRHAMGSKPFLLLELDSHVADAGLETRIEAFLDIISNYREAGHRKGSLPSAPGETRLPAHFHHTRQLFIDSCGRKIDWHDPRVNVLIPSMGKLGNKAIAAVFRSAGIRATALPSANEETLRLGRAHTSGKECLPLLVLLGSLFNHLQQGRSKDDLLLYFIPSAAGPCRFGQYSFFIRHIIKKLQISDVALFSMQAENGYRELGGRDFSSKLWSATVLSDIFQDIKSLLLANAPDKIAAIDIFERSWNLIISSLETSPDYKNIKAVLEVIAKSLSTIEGRIPWHQVPTILLTGEIFVRHDDLSRQFMVEKLAEQGWSVKTAGVMEWVYYTDYCLVNNLAAKKQAWHQRPETYLKIAWMKSYERAYKKIMARSGLTTRRSKGVRGFIKDAADLINPQLTGEAILTVGGAISEIPGHYSGVIALGPFGCMPNRLAEAILSREMGWGWQQQAHRRRGLPPRIVAEISELPFLAIESDGNSFPQFIAAKLEVFLSQAARMHRYRNE
ncbi:MAG: acyl-CoA dehydratase activase [Syntrophales bacterium]